MSKVVHLKLDEEQEKDIIKVIDEGMSDIVNARADINFEGTCDENEDLYDGISEPTDFPWVGASHRTQKKIMVAVDVVQLDAKDAALNNGVVCVFEPEEGTEYPEEDLTDRADRLDYKIRKCDLDSLLSAAYTQAAKQGTGIIKIPLVDECDYVTRFKTYKYTPEGMAEYAKDHENDSESSIAKALEDIALKGEIEVETEIKVEEYYGPKPYTLKNIKDLYLLHYETDLSKQRIINEKRQFGWKDIQNRVDKEYFYVDKIDELIGKKGDQYQKERMTFWECILYTDIIKPGKFKRYVITYEEQSKIIVRAIHYPFDYINYAFYYIKRRNDSIYGYSLSQIGKDNQEIISALVNQAINRASLRERPPLAMPADSAAFAIDWKPGAKIPSKDPSKLPSILRTDQGGNDSLLVESVVERLFEMEIGVNSGASGREAPLDPRAPLGKALLMQQNSDKRIGAYIKELQKGNERLYMVFEWMLNEYKPEDLKYYKDKTQKSLSPKVTNYKVRYIPQGMRVALDKQAEKQGIVELLQIMAQFFPELMQDMRKRLIFLREYINLHGGPIERRKNEIIPSEQEIEMQEINNAIQQEAAQVQQQSVEGVKALEEKIVGMDDTKAEKLLKNYEQRISENTGTGI